MPTKSTTPVDPAKIKDDAYYHVTLTGIAHHNGRPLLPQGRHRMKGRVVKAIIEKVSHAEPV